MGHVLDQDMVTAEVGRNGETNMDLERAVLRKLRGIQSSLKISESLVSKLNWKVVGCKTGPGGDIRTDLSGLEREFESRIVVYAICSAF